MGVIGESKILPIHVQLALESFGAPEFAMAAGSADALAVKVEHSDAAQISRELEAALGISVTIESLAAGTLPRSAYKPRRLASA